MAMAPINEIRNTASASMAARKRERAPEFLRRLFGNRARTLADTILALIPPPPAAEAACRCNGRRCLYCSGDGPMSFLLRSGDSPDYREFMTGCFVVVSEDAPPAPVSDLHCRWSQREIVRRSIEIILLEQPSTPNLICCSYDKDSRSSAAVDELTSSKWTVLLRRVGDSLMMYLLKYTSIFLPLPQKKHHQISGHPVGDLCSKFSGRRPMSRSQHHPPAHRGSTYVSEESPSTQNEGNSKKKRTREYRWQRQRKRGRSGNNSLISCSDNLIISSSSQSDMNWQETREFLTVYRRLME